MCEAMCEHQQVDELVAFSLNRFGIQFMPVGPATGQQSKSQIKAEQHRAQSTEPQSKSGNKLP
eukprot:scaffold696346_cov51-Attheya_sp.AAC.3